MARDVTIRVKGEADTGAIRRAERDVKSLKDSVDGLEDRVAGLRAASDLIGDIFTGAILGGAFADIVLEGAAALRDFANASVEAYTAANTGSELTIAYTEAQAGLTAAQQENAELVGEVLIPLYTDFTTILIGVNSTASDFIVTLDQMKQGYDRTVESNEYLNQGLDILGGYLRVLALPVSWPIEAAGLAASAFYDAGEEARIAGVKMAEAITTAESYDRALMQSSRAAQEETAAQNQRIAAYERGLLIQETYIKNEELAAEWTSNYVRQLNRSTATYRENVVATANADKVQRSFGGGVRSTTSALTDQEKALQRLERSQASYFDKALQAEELEWNLSEALYESARAAGASTQALEVLALASGFPPEKIEEALRYAAVMAQIEELGRAIAEGEISVEEAVAQVQNFQNNTTNSNVTIGTINAGGQSVGSVVNELQSQGG